MLINEVDISTPSLFSMKHSAKMFMVKFKGHKTLTTVKQLFIFGSRGRKRVLFP